MHRQTGVDIPALPPVRRAPTDGRYHRAGDPWPLYASLDPATAWAEWRAATGGAIDPSTERRRLWRLDVAGLRVLDLRREEVRAALSVDLDELVGPRARCQALAARAHRIGAEGMIVPSAARIGSWNLVAFPPALRAVTPVGSSVRAPAPPPTAPEPG